MNGKKTVEFIPCLWTLYLFYKRFWAEINMPSSRPSIMELTGPGRTVFLSYRRQAVHLCYCFVQCRSNYHVGVHAAFPSPPPHGILLDQFLHTHSHSQKGLEKQLEDISLIFRASFVRWCPSISDALSVYYLRILECLHWDMPSYKQYYSYQFVKGKNYG